MRIKWRGENPRIHSDLLINRMGEWMFDLLILVIDTEVIEHSRLAWTVFSYRKIPLAQDHKAISQPLCINPLCIAKPQHYVRERGRNRAFLWLSVRNREFHYQYLSRPQDYFTNEHKGNWVSKDGESLINVFFKKNCKNCRNLKLKQ